jgi:hypothetical protein
MRGLDTALPNVRPRLSLSYYGRRQCLPQSIRREFLCRCLAPTLAQHMEVVRGAAAYAAWTILPIAHMNPTSARAIAVITTVSFLPLPDNTR